MLRLVLPSVRYKTSFLRAFTPESQYLGWNKAVIQHDFAQFVKELRGRRHGHFLPPQFVPDTFYWLVEGGRYIGTATIRHRLNRHLLRIGGHIGYMIAPSERNKGNGTKILSLTLKKVRAMGFKKILITCDETNDPSYKIIIANGGVLKNYVTQGRGLPKKIRFWIQL